MPDTTRTSSTPSARTQARSKDRAVALSFALTVAAMVAGCGTSRPAPVRERAAPPPSPSTPAAPPVAIPAAPIAAAPQPRLHVVQKGDTLISIALQYGLDYRELAAWNSIENINVIRVGQELRVSAPGGDAAAVASAAPAAPVVTPLGALPSQTLADTRPLANTSTVKVEPHAAKVPYSDKALAQMEAETARAAAGTAGSITGTPLPPVAVTLAPPAPSRGDDDSVDWAWPAKGKVVGAYSETSKGVDIGGTLGLPVFAAAGGKVVYSGTGLRGYGKLVIIKHNNTYLSAYAHNNNILVKEGQDVKKGQKIAEMGSTDTDQVKLHFEIRKQGKPVDPGRFLPAG